MTERSSPQKFITPTHKPVSFADELLNLLTIRNLDVLLRKALGVAVRSLEAEAGSILFEAGSMRRLRAGIFRQNVANHIDYWEQAVQQRLQEDSAQPFKEMPAAFTHELETGQLLINQPILRNTKVMGGCLSLIIPNGKLNISRRATLTKVAEITGHMASLIADMELAQRRLKQLNVVYQVGQALVTTFDLQKLLNDTMQLATNVIDAAAASLMLIDESTQELVLEIAPWAKSRGIRKLRTPLGEGIAGWVARSGQPIVINEPRTDPRFSYQADMRTGFLMQSIVAVPLQIKGRVIGVLELLNKYSGDGFSQEDLRVLTAVAAHAAIAIENARLYEQVRNDHDRMIAAQEEIRQAAANQLHDGPLQYFSAISMGLDHLEHVATAATPEAIQASVKTLRNLVEQASQDTRQVLSRLRSVNLDEQGLIATLKQYVQQLQDSEPFTVHFQTVAHLNYDRQVARTILAIIQAGINNIQQHAEAKNVGLSVAVKTGRCLITLKDDGVGFDTAILKNDSGRRVAVGIATMYEQAQTIHARLQIKSQTEPPHHGTTITLLLAAPA